MVGGSCRIGCDKERSSCFLSVLIWQPKSKKNWKGCALNKTNTQINLEILQYQVEIKSEDKTTAH
jgi:hypothetical protein